MRVDNTLRPSKPEVVHYDTNFTSWRLKSTGISMQRTVRPTPNYATRFACSGPRAAGGDIGPYSRTDYPP
eukprot:9200063-Pyramimonas_sp.AAC.1